MLAGHQLPAAVLTITLASSAIAQTPDPAFAGYRFAPPEVGSRPAGLAGAFVGIADDTRAAFVNPAGLALIPISEIALSSGEPWGAVAVGRKHLQFAGYLTQSEQKTSRLDSTALEGGFAVGVQPGTRVNLGAAVAWSRLKLGPSGTTEAAGPTGQDTHARFTGGVLFDLLDNSRRALPTLRLGISYQPGFDWSVPRAPRSGTGSVLVDVRRPTLLSTALAYRPSDRWMLALEGDLIRYREVLETLRRNASGTAPDFSLPDALEPRFGVEFSSRLWCGCGSVKLRGGVRYRSAGTLRYGGADPALAAAFDRKGGETVATLGGSFLGEYLGHALRLDLDSRDLIHGPDLSIGIVFRF
jgi:hypothetical protein